MYSSGWSDRRRDESLAAAEREVALGEPPFPEGEVTKPKHHLGLLADNLQLFEDRTTLGIRHDTVDRRAILAGVAGSTTNEKEVTGIIEGM